MQLFLSEDENLQTELYAKFFHGLSNAIRFKITEILLEGERSVGELVELLGISQGQVSNHLACLKWCGYVSARQDSKRVIYRVSDERVRTLMELARSIVADNAERIRSCTRM